MATLLIVVFVIGYALIAMEHPLKLDKAASAMLTGVFCWMVLAYGYSSMPAAAGTSGTVTEILEHSLFEHLGEIAGILFFLLCAMTIVELVDVHDGFRVITDRITTTDRIKLMWIISWVTFFLSAGLDNMTTAIIMCALIRRLIKKQENVWLFGGFVIIAANAGGAWSPIGDVTTIMLWIGGQVSTVKIMQSLFIPSAVSLLVPLLIASFYLKGKMEAKNLHEEHIDKGFVLPAWEKNLMLVLGGVALLSVPVFKYFTHFPPYMGILLSLGLLWYITEFLHRGDPKEVQHDYSVGAMLRRIDTPSILFFLGILLAVGALDTSGHLVLAADFLNNSIGNIYLINTIIGLLSSIVDNVPLVAAAMGMYDMNTFATDHPFWESLAYCAGTGGSILIIGSAAGVASMGILKIDFLWYMRHISLYALIGYLCGIGTYYLMSHG